LIFKKGYKPSEEHRRKISKATKGRIPWNKNKIGIYKASEETRKKISLAGKGHVVSEETRKKIGNANRGFTS